MRRSFQLSLVAVLAAASVVYAQRKQDDRFSDVTSVVAVEVPVQVIVDGQPVRGLTKDNFEILDGRSRQEITGFEVIDLREAGQPSSGGRTAPAVPPAMRRHFLFLFDLSFSEPESLVNARQAAREMVRTSLHPTDVVAVATYSLSKGPELLLGFTPDRRQAELMFDTLGKPELLDRNPDPLLLSVADLEAARPDTGGGSQGQGAEAREGRDAALLEDLKQAAAMSGRAQRQNEVGRVTGLTRSMADLAKLLSSVKGRKHVVYLSEGFDSTLLVGRETGDDLDTTRAIESGEMWNVDSETRYGSSKVQNDLEKMMEEFRRADCVIQSVDIGGLRTDTDQRPRASGEAGLLAMAKDTGGELYKNFNNLGTAMGQMLERTSVTYLLVFQPDVKSDGSYRKIDVKLKNAPRGARLVHRPGYYTPKPYQQLTGVERQLQAAQAIVGGQEGGQLDLSVMATPFRPVGEKAWVPVLVEVGGPSLFAGHSGDLLAAEVYIYAMDEVGTVRDFVVQSIGLDLKKAPASLRQTGLKFFGHVDLPPGSYTVRAMVRNGQTGATGVRVQPITVPSQMDQTAVLLPPLFPEPMGKWMIARETPAENEPAPVYPYMLNEAPYVPAALPSWSNADQVIALVGYNLAGASDFRLQVSTLDGKKLADTPLGGVERLQSSGGAERLLASFKPSGLSPGLYEVRLAAQGAAGPISSAPVVVEVAGR